MTDQREALRLAALLDATHFSEHTHPAANELRRLHAENKALRTLLADIRKDEQTLHWHKSIDAEIDAIDAARSKT